MMWKKKTDVPAVSPSLATPVLSPFGDGGRPPTAMSPALPAAPTEGGDVAPQPPAVPPPTSPPPPPLMEGAMTPPPAAVASPPLPPPDAHVPPEDVPLPPGDLSADEDVAPPPPPPAEAGAAAPTPPPEPIPAPPQEAPGAPEGPPPPVSPPAPSVTPAGEGRAMPTPPAPEADGEAAPEPADATTTAPTPPPDAPAEDASDRDGSADLSPPENWTGDDPTDADPPAPHSEVLFYGLRIQREDIMSHPVVEAVLKHLNLGKRPPDMHVTVFYVGRKTSKLTEEDMATLDRLFNRLGDPVHIRLNHLTVVKGSSNPAAIAVSVCDDEITECVQNTVPHITLGYVGQAKKSNEYLSNHMKNHSRVMRMPDHNIPEGLGPPPSNVATFDLGGHRVIGFLKAWK